MGGIANVLIKIGAETASAVTEIRKVNTALDDQMTASQRASAGIRKAAVPAAAAFALVSAAAIDWTKKAAEDADAQTQLAGALKRTTGASDEAVKGAESYIDALSRQVAIADDDLRPALAKLAGATGSVAAGQKQLAIAADIAAQAHVPLATATNALVKADQGRYAGLAKLVPALDDQLVKSKDQQAILEQTAKLTAGAATEAAGTYAGQQKALTISIAETEEAIGRGFLPVLQTLMPILKRVADFVADNTTAVRYLVIAVGAVSGAILVANGALKAYEAATVLVKVATTTWTAVQWLLNAALDANPIGAVVIAVGLLTAGIVLAYQKSDTFRAAVDRLWDAIKDLFQLGLIPLKVHIDAARAAWNLAQNVFESGIGHAAIDGLRAAVDALRGAFNAAKDAAVAIAGYLAGGATAAFNAFTGVVGSLSSAFSTLIGWIQSAISWLGKIRIPKGITGILDKIPHVAAPPAPALSAGRSRFAYAYGTSGSARSSARSSGPAGGLTINLYGPLDPEGTARAIVRVLNGHERRQGRAS